MSNLHSARSVTYIRYLRDEAYTILSYDHNFPKGEVCQDTLDTEAPFLDLNLSITNGIVSSKIYDKRDDFNFETVNFPFF